MMVTAASMTFEIEDGNVNIWVIKPEMTMRS